MSQAEMKRRAIRRPKDDDDEPAAQVAEAQVTQNESSPVAGSADSSRDEAVAAVNPQASTSSVGSGSPASPPAAGASSAEATEPSSAASPVAVSPVAAPAAPLGAVERRARTIQNLERIGVALEKHLEQKGAYPAATIHIEGRALLSWRVALLPYLGYEDLYKQFHLNEPWDSPHNRKLLPLVPEPYQSPDRFDEKTNYLGVVGRSFAFDDEHGRMLSQIEDGVINTALVVEADEARAVPWTAPQDFVPDGNNPLEGLGKLREDGFFVLWGGGTVGRIAADADQRKVYAMLSIAGGENFMYSDLHQAAVAQVAAVEPEPPASAAGSGAGSGAVSSASGASDMAVPVPGNARPLPTRVAGAAAPKLRPPDDEAEKDILETLREIYEPQFKKTRQRSERVALSREMLTKADRLTDDPAARFVLLKLVARIASESGDLTVSQQALDKLKTSYEFDQYSLLTETLKAVSRVEEAPPGELIKAALNAAEEGVERDEYETARDMHGIAVTHSRDAKGDDDQNRIILVRRKIDNAQRGYQEVLRSLERLEAAPDDPDANASVGKYFCLIKGDWPRGLPFLAKAGDELLTQAAERELQNPGTPDEMAAAGDAWWAFGEDHRNARRNAQLRAVYWYLRVLQNGNSGIAGIKSEVRVQQAEKSFGTDEVQKIRDQLRAGTPQRFAADED